MIRLPETRGWRRQRRLIYVRRLSERAGLVSRGWLMVARGELQLFEEHHKIFDHKVAGKIGGAANRHQADGEPHIKEVTIQVASLVPRCINPIPNRREGQGCPMLYFAHIFGFSPELGFRE